MNVLFVNPYIYDFTAYDLWLRPLGNLYLASVVNKYSDCNIYWIDTLDRFQTGIETKSRSFGRGKYNKETVNKPEIYDPIPRTYSRYGMPIDLFRKKLDDLPEVDIIFVTTLMTYWIEGVNFTIKELRKRFGKSKIVVGGILPTLIGNSINRYIEADTFISGYGEKKILELLRSQNCNIKKYPDFSDINNIPFPANRYLSNRKVLPLLTSRGCPFHCTYCASDLLNEKFLQRKPDNIIDEIFFMNNKFNTEDFIIFDDAFLINKEKRFFRVFERIKEKLNVRFHTPNGIHTKEIDRMTAELLYLSGFKTIRLSFESTDNTILKKSSDKVNVNQMENAVRNLLDSGYSRSDIECYLLFGLPGQTVSEIERSISFIKSLGIIPRLSFFSPVPGTIEFLSLHEAGVIPKEDYLLETNKIHFLYTKSDFSIQDIEYIQKITKEASIR